MPNFRPTTEAQRNFLGQIDQAVNEQLKGAIKLFDDLNIRAQLEEQYQRPVFDPATLEKINSIATEAGKLAPGIGTAIGTIVGQSASVGGDLVKMYQTYKDKQAKIEFYNMLLAANMIMRALKSDWESRTVTLNTTQPAKSDTTSSDAKPDASAAKTAKPATTAQPMGQAASADQKEQPNSLLLEDPVVLAKIAQIATDVAEHLTWRFQHVLDSLDAGKNSNDTGDVFPQQLSINMRHYFAGYADGELTERLVNASTYKEQNGMQTIEHLKKVPIYLANGQKGNMHSLLYLSPVFVYNDNPSKDHNTDQFVAIRGHQGDSWRTTHAATPSNPNKGAAFLASVFHYASKDKCRLDKYAPLDMYNSEVTKLGWSYRKREVQGLPKPITDLLPPKNRWAELADQKDASAPADPLAIHVTAASAATGATAATHVESVTASPEVSATSVTPRPIATPTPSGDLDISHVNGSTHTHDLPAQPAAVPLSSTLRP